MSGLLRARGQIAFLIGLVLASAVVFWLDQQQAVPASDILPAPGLIHTPPRAARSAWRYFERNTDPDTGLVSSNEGGTSTTARDIGHGLQAALAAHRLGLITGRELYHRLRPALRSAAMLELRHAAAGAYDVGSLRPLPAPGGDPQVLVGALELIAWSYPASSGDARRALQRWRTVERSTHPTTTKPSDATQQAVILVEAAMQHGGDK